MDFQEEAPVCQKKIAPHWAIHQHIMRVCYMYQSCICAWSLKHSKSFHFEDVKILRKMDHNFPVWRRQKNPQKCEAAQAQGKVGGGQ